MSLQSKVFVITGGLRGIGLQICLTLQAKDARVVILGSKLDNQEALFRTAGLDESLATYHTCDLRDDQDIKQSIDSIYQEFGAIDGIIHNAAVINTSGSIDIKVNALDLMYQVNARAAWLLVKSSFEYLNESTVKQVIGICPPINLDPTYLGTHLPYVATRYLAGMFFSGMATENPSLKINTLWPKTTIDAPDICNIIAGSYEDMSKHHRSSQIMADACVGLIEAQAFGQTGENFIDEEVLRSLNINSFERYELSPKNEEKKEALVFEEEDPYNK